MLNNKEWLNKLDNLLKRFKINPKNYSIYLEAFTHQSYSYAHKLDYNYQKLEFLGDAFISWITCKYLYSKMHEDEGIMTQVKANLVNGKMLSEVAKKLSIPDIIIIGGGLEVIGDKIIEDVFEAFIGAVYEDQGYVKAKAIIEELLISKIENGDAQLRQKSPKSEIQEYLMKNVKCSSGAIKYVSIKNEEEGYWISEVKVGDITYGKGQGRKLRDAENSAAEDALSRCIHNIVE